MEKHISFTKEDMDFCFGSVNPAQIILVEKELSKKLPVSFKEMVSMCDAGYPKKSDFIFFDISLGDYTLGCIGALLAFSPEYPHEKILEYYHNPPEFFPEGLVGFAVDGGGNVICFDYRQDPDTNDPPIVYWIHDVEDEESISPIAKNFDAFLSMLMSEEEAEKELERLRNEPKQE